jgi:c-di-GMP-binding flagellar brake protein YcgR
VHQEQTTDRRQHKRYSVQDGVFAVLGPFPTKMGQIIDISNGGLSFYHRNGLDSEPDTYELSILFDDNQNSINYGPLKFQAQVVSETDIKDNAESNTTPMTRCGLAFEDLTYYQRSWLADCIQNFTHK